MNNNLKCCVYRSIYNQTIYPICVSIETYCPPRYGDLYLENIYSVNDCEECQNIIYNKGGYCSQPNCTFQGTCFAHGHKMCWADDYQYECRNGGWFRLGRCPYYQNTCK